MKKVISKAFCVASAVVVCLMSELPVFAISEEKMIYNKMKNSGEVYKTIVDNKDSEEKMPIETQIKYYLDDKEISVDNIKGKSGKIKIEVNYTNTDVKIVDLNGKKVKMYTPYVVACGMMLDNNVFSNITVSNGKLIENGLDTMLIGIAMPGLQESLELSEKDIKIPSGFTIEADVKNFKLGNMYMYVASNLFDKDSFNFLDEFESIYDDIQNLKNASTQLVEGTVSLKEGTNTYLEKFDEFNNGLSAYTQGVNLVSQNYTKISDGISNVDENTKKIAIGSDNLSEGITELKNNLINVMNALSSLKQGTDAIYSNLGVMASSVENSIVTIQESVSEDSQAHQSLVALGTATGTTIYKLNQTKVTLQSTADSMEDGDVKDTLLEQINNLDEQILELNTNISNERTAYNNVITQETTQVVTGLNTIKESLEKLQGVAGQVKGGIDQIANNAPALQTGLDELESGANMLSNGASSLSSGVSTLAKGADELKNGINNLNSNTNTIANAGTQLKDGASTIAKGANTLSEGTNKFDKEGIDTIYNLVNGNVKTVQTRIEKLMNLAQNSENNVSYKYIVKVDGTK